MKIEEVVTVTESHYHLLLDADPSREWVTEYLQRGRLFEAHIAKKVVGFASNLTYAS